MHFAIRSPGSELGLRVSQHGRGGRGGGGHARHQRGSSSPGTFFAQRRGQSYEGVCDKDGERGCGNGIASRWSSSPWSSCWPRPRALNDTSYRPSMEQIFSSWSPSSRALLGGEIAMTSSIHQSAWSQSAERLINDVSPASSPSPSPPRSPPRSTEENPRVLALPAHHRGRKNLLLRTSIMLVVVHTYWPHIAPLRILGSAVRQSRAPNPHGRGPARARRRRRAGESPLLRFVSYAPKCK